MANCVCMYLHTSQDQNELHLKRWFLFFFLPKSASSVSRSQAHLAKRCSRVYPTIFVRRKDKTNYLSNQTWAKCYHTRNKQDLQFKVDSERQIFLEKLFMAGLFLLSEFFAEICWEEIVAEILFIFRFDVWPGARTLAIASNKPTHYLLDHGDFSK